MPQNPHKHAVPWPNPSQPPDTHPVIFPFRTLLLYCIKYFNTQLNTQFWRSQ
jgi:hypothetical protein